jgi:hypothetical protein
MMSFVISKNDLWYKYSHFLLSQQKIMQDFTICLANACHFDKDISLVFYDRVNFSIKVIW